MSKASLAALPGTSGGRSFGLHASLAPLVPLYEQQRLAFIANVGTLVRPATARQVLDRAVDVPPFLLSHSDQTAMVQGWTVTAGINGWAGRGLESLPPELQNKLAAVTFDTNRTLVLGRHSPVTNLPLDGGRYWTLADLKFGERSGTLPSTGWRNFSLPMHTKPSTAAAWARRWTIPLIWLTRWAAPSCPRATLA